MEMVHKIVNNLSSEEFSWTLRTDLLPLGYWIGRFQIFPVEEELLEEMGKENELPTNRFTIDNSHPNNPRLVAGYDHSPDCLLFLSQVTRNGSAVLTYPLDESTVKIYKLYVLEKNMDDTMHGFIVAARVAPRRTLTIFFRSEKESFLRQCLWDGEKITDKLFIYRAKGRSEQNSKRIL